MARLVLDSATSTGLTRITVHSQYNSRAFGFYVLANLVPIILTIRRLGPSYHRAVLVFGKKTRKRSPYKDFGIVEKCCRKVYTFNIRHYVKCYLNSPSPEPFTYNECSVCRARVVDSSGHTIQSIVRRSYRPDKFVWRPLAPLQSGAEREAIFNFHEGIL